MSFQSLSPEIKELAERELTRKQLDVFKLWLAGAGTTRIALMLDIAEPTARGHLTRAKQKLKPYLEDAA